MIPEENEEVVILMEYFEDEKTPIPNGSKYRIIGFEAIELPNLLNKVLDIAYVLAAKIAHSVNAPTLQHTIYSVLKEMVKNAIVHGNKTDTDVDLTQPISVGWSLDKGKLVLRVGDNGTVTEFEAPVGRDVVRTYEARMKSIGMVSGRSGLSTLRGSSFFKLRSIEPIMDEGGKQIGKFLVVETEPIFAGLKI